MTKIATVNMLVHPRDTEVNRQTMVRYINEAAEQDVDLIVFPEECFTGFGTHGVRQYDFEDKRYLHNVSQLVPEGEFTQQMIAMAQEKGIYICYGISELDPNRSNASFNTAVLVGPEGYVGKYRKTHMPMNERFMHYQGDGQFPVFDTAIGKIGLSICYDSCFPEVARALAVQGAEIILNPTCWPDFSGELDDPSLVAFNTFGSARAWENQVFYVASNYAGKWQAGHSAVYGPIPGQVLACSGFDEGMFVADCGDIQEQIFISRNDTLDGNSVLQDRCPHAYQVLVEPDPYTYGCGGEAKFEA